MFAMVAPTDVVVTANAKKGRVANWCDGKRTNVRNDCTRYCHFGSAQPGFVWIVQLALVSPFRCRGL